MKLQILSIPDPLAIIPSKESLKSMSPDLIPFSSPSLPGTTTDHVTFPYPPILEHSAVASSPCRTVTRAPLAAGLHWPVRFGANTRSSGTTNGSADICMGTRAAARVAAAMKRATVACTGTLRELVLLTTTSWPISSPRRSNWRVSVHLRVFRVIEWCGHTTLKNNWEKG